MVDFAHRALWFVLVTWMLTGCMMLPTSTLPRATVLPLPSPSISSNTQVLSYSHGAGNHSTSPFQGAGNSAASLVRHAEPVWSLSSISLSQNGDGSMSVHSAGRPVSLLRGLDPALVNPAVLPFLFPSCDVPVPPVGVSR